MKVCMVSEGAYPAIRGGLGEWSHNLIKNMSTAQFEVFCLSTNPEKPKWETLPNINSRVIVPFMGASYGKMEVPDFRASRRLIGLINQVLSGQAVDMEGFIRYMPKVAISKKWLLSKDHWDFIADYYDRSNPDSSFTEFYWTILGLDAILIDTLNAFFHLQKADLYHAMSAAFAGFLSSMAKVMYHKPFILTEQGIYLRERENEMARLKASEWFRSQQMKFSESMVKTTYRYADIVVPPCYSHKRLEEKYGLDMKKVKVINNGIDCGHFLPVISPNGHGPVPLVGCFARVVSIKGIEVLIKAASKVCRNHKVEFAVIGEVQEEDYFKECQKMVEQLGLTGRFKFLGHQNPLEWYHKTDIFTLTSHSEGVPYALLEAMSCEIPAVCTAVGGVPEIVRKDTGFVVPPNQPDALADKISLLLDNAELRKKMGKRGREIALQDYTIAQTVSNFYSLYKELLYGRRHAKVRFD